MTNQHTGDAPDGWSPADYFRQLAAEQYLASMAVDVPFFEQVFGGQATFEHTPPAQLPAPVIRPSAEACLANETRATMAKARTICFMFFLPEV
jgi:hypothetical protein